MQACRAPTVADDPCRLDVRLAAKREVGITIPRLMLQIAFTTYSLHTISMAKVLKQTVGQTFLQTWQVSKVPKVPKS